MLLFMARACSKILLKFNTKLHGRVPFQHRISVANINALQGKFFICVVSAQVSRRKFPIINSKIRLEQTLIKDHKSTNVKQKE